VKNRDCHKRQQKHLLIPKDLTGARLTVPVSCPHLSCRGAQGELKKERLRRKKTLLALLRGLRQEGELAASLHIRDSAARIGIA
jgi:hypothetical protein